MDSPKPVPDRCRLRAHRAQFRAAFRPLVGRVHVRRSGLGNRHAQAPDLLGLTVGCTGFTGRARQYDLHDLPCGVGLGIGSSSGGGVPLADFAAALGSLVQRAVIDRTGLTGVYDIEITFNSEQQLPVNLPPGIVPPRIDPDAPSIFTAIEEQLGLRLQPGRGPVEVLVIDSVERPQPD